MSGPKCGEVHVSDRRRLEQERRHREEAEAREREALEEKALCAERQQARLEEKERRRLEHLRQKERRRREREAERLRQARERAGQARQAELAHYHRLRSQLEAALAARADLQARFEGLVLPERPGLPDADLSTAEAVRRATEQLAGIAREYQQRVDLALMDHHRREAGARAAADMRAWAAGFRARATLTAKDVVAALESETLMAAAGRRQSSLAAMAGRARELVESVSRRDGGELSEATLAALDEVLAAENEGAGQVALARLRQAVESDLARWEQARREAEARRLAEERAIEAEERRLVAAEVQDALEDLGYVVSGIEDTAFVQRGQLFAAHRDWPDHVVRFEFEAGSGRVRTAPLRIAGPNPAPGAADARLLEREDAAFDAEWCGANGLGRFRDLARRRGIEARFRAEHRPGELEVGRTTEEAVGEAIRQTRRETREDRKLKSRTR
jgi:hypothetical protein